MPIYRTEYEVPCRQVLSTSCWAKDEVHLQELLALRKMDEVHAGRWNAPLPEMASDLIR